MQSTAERLTYEVLGPVRVRAGDHDVALGGPRQVRVLALLLLTPDHSISLPRLIDGVWDDHPPATAKRQVQNCVSMLRRDLTEAGEAPVIVSGGTGFRIRIGRGQLDARVFADQVAAADEARRSGRPAEAVVLLRGALRMWRGPALTGCTGRTVETAAAQLDEQRLSAAEECLDLELFLGRHTHLVAELSGLVAAHPLRERLVGQLMLALHRSGRQADALTAYQRLRRRLADDLGLSPGDELRRLHDAILRNEVAVRPDGTRLDPPQETDAGPAWSPLVVPRQLPAPLRHFIGRTSEVDGLLRQADAAGPTVCVVSGPAGIGKTAIALQAAHRLAPEFPDGQLHVDLRGSTNSSTRPAQALRNILDALGVPADQLPAGLDARIGLYRSLLADRRALVLLDDAAAEEQVRPFLPGAGPSLVIVTSRSPLTGLVADGAHATTVEGLSVTHAGELLTRHLGGDRVSAEPGAVCALIERCAGLPLALAVVAARANYDPTAPLAVL